MATAVRAITAITLVATALTGCSSKPQASPPRSGSVWVADEGHDSVSVIDAGATGVAGFVAAVVFDFVQVFELGFGLTEGEEAVADFVALGLG